MANIESCVSEDMINLTFYFCCFDLDDVRVVTASLGAIFSHTNRRLVVPGLTIRPPPSLLSHFLSRSSVLTALKIVGDLLDSGILSGHCEPCY